MIFDLFRQPTIRFIALAGCVLALCLVIFYLVYTPHREYPYPLHIDEWHHISQSRRLVEGEYMQRHVASGFGAIEIGFHFFLLPISKFTNIITTYQYLPALWAVFSGLALFGVVTHKTKKPIVGLLAMGFFASLKSNVNILGLWFFTPFSFSIPFVFLYTYLLTEGVIRKSLPMVLAGLIIMTILIPFYATAILFAVPALLIFAYQNRAFIQQHAKYFWGFLLVPIVGLIFYRNILDIEWTETFGHLQQSLQFRFGWGVLELNNAWTEAYSIFGYAMALIGALFLVITKQYRNYLFYLLWPLTLLLSIELFRESGYSFFAPYQRNFYYLALSMPLLSALGVYHLLTIAADYFQELKLSYAYGLTVVVSVLFVSIGAFFSFQHYFDLPTDLDVYHVISDRDYRTLTRLAEIPPSKVMAPPFFSTAVYAVSGHHPYADIFFVGNRQVAEEFFQFESCSFREAIIDNQQIEHVISDRPLNCDWPLVYSGSGFIYRVDSLQTVSP